MVARKKMVQAKAVTLPSQTFRAVFLSLLVIAIYMVLCTNAFADDTTPMGDVLCTVVYFIIDGNLGRGLATLAVITLGVGALLGKVSWGLALTVGIGISVMFGAPDIVEKLTQDGIACYS